MPQAACAHACMQEGMAHQSRRFHWDKRKRQYVQLQPGETVRAGKRHKTEAGKHTKLTAGSGGRGLYAKWAKHNQSRIVAAGQMEDAKSVAAAKGLTDR